MRRGHFMRSPIAYYAPGRRHTKRGASHVVNPPGTKILKHFLRTGMDPNIANMVRKIQPNYTLIK